MLKDYILSGYVFRLWYLVTFLILVFSVLFDYKDYRHLHEEIFLLDFISILNVEQ